MRFTCRFAAIFLCLLCAPGLSRARSTRHTPRRFLIVSAPRSSKVSYLHLKSGGSSSSDSMTDLITSGLVSPQGIARDQVRGKLFVADPGASKIFSYSLIATGDTLSVGEQHVAVDNVESRWVSVDSFGNLLYSNEPQNEIMRTSGQSVLRNEPTSEVLYNGATVSTVSAPGGVATDDLHTYWVNKQNGKQVGSVMRAMSSASSPSLLQGGLASSVQSLASNSDKSYGLCVAMGNVFYTQPDRLVYAVKKGGGSPVLVSDRLTNPRGCAWDGDGTVYVADRGANSVYSFAGNMHQLSTAQLSVAAKADDAFGVAVYTARDRKSVV